MYNIIMIIIIVTIIITITMGKLIKALNILSLHGKGGTGLTFKTKLKPLIDSFNNNNWHFLDGPHILDNNRKRLNTENRKDDDNVNKKIDRAWWLLPDNIRSFEALKYEGVDQSIQLIESNIKSNNIDVIIGHSQGAMMGGIILARSILGVNNISNLKGAILSSPAWPLPFTGMLEDLSNVESIEEKKIQTIFTIGLEDKVNPPAQSKMIADVFKSSTNVHIFEHNYGHVLPIDTKAIEIYSKLLKIL